MKNHIRSTLIVVAALFAAAVAHAADPTYSVVTALTGFNVRSNMATNVTASAACTLDVRRQQKVDVEISFNLTGAGTDNIGFNFLPGLDSTVTNSVQAPTSFMANIAANGTTRVNLFTNWTVNTYGYLHLYYVSNNVAIMGVTNIQVRYAVKSQSP